MQLLLTAEESVVLGEVLSHYLTDLRGEIGKTDSYDARQELHKREATLRAIAGRLKVAAEAG